MKNHNLYTGIMFCVACVLAISSNSQVAMAAEFFVATTGNDSNSGTINSPFRTLEKATSVMVSGDTMNIRTGTYRRTAWSLDVPSGGGSWSTATTIKAYNKEKVIITPQDPTQNGTDVILLPPGKSYIIFDGLILDGLRSGTTNGGRMAFRFQTSSGSNPSHHIRLINMEARYTYTNLILTNDATHNEFINLNLHHGAHNLVPDSSGSCKTNPPALWCYRVYGIYMSSGNNLVKDCDIHHNQGHGVSQYSGWAYKPHNNTYINNKFHHNHWAGLILGRGDNTLMINNLFYENGYGSFDIVGRTPTSSRVGIYIDGPSGGPINGTKLSNNTFYNNYLGEIYISDANNSILRNNILFGNNGYIVENDTATIGTVIENNLIYNGKNSSKLIANNGTESKISNNLIGSAYDPLFVSKNTPDFHLTSGSPVIGKGMTLNEVKTDFDNVQRKEPFDIGAYAFGSTPLPVNDTTPPASPKNVRIQ